MKLRNALVATLLAVVSLTGCSPSSSENPPTTKNTAPQEACSIDRGEDHEWFTSNGVKLGDTTFAVVVNYDATDVAKRSAEIRFTEGPATTFMLGDKLYVVGLGTLQLTVLRGPRDGNDSAAVFRFWPNMEC